MAFSYRVSLQIKHPLADPNDIATAIEMTPSRSWRTGEARVTPKGQPLPGQYRENYCVFDLGDGDDGELADFLRGVIERLGPASAFLKNLCDTSGSLVFYVSWSCGDRGEVFDTALMSDMARLGIDLGIEPFSTQ